VSRTIYLELAEGTKMATDLQVGGLFVIDKLLTLQEHCEIVVFNDGGQLELPAKAVYLDGNGGVGLELIGFDDELRAKITTLLEAGAAAQATPPPEEPIAELEPSGTAEPAEPLGEAAPEAALAADDSEEHKTLHERLRGLPLVEQIKRAKGGTVTERTLLERLYGKNVWEALLRNPALTAPEIARIARMGALPRPMLEIIFGNGGWLQIPEVRRALLSNPRLGTDQIIKLLRMMNKQELKLATMQTAYSMAVRSQAKTLLKAETG
jgi:hypothetical protein